MQIFRIDDTLILRPWKRNDAESLVMHANNKNVADNLRDGFPHPYTLETAHNWLEAAINDQNNILLAIDIKGNAVGGVGIITKDDVYRLSAEVGYWLSESYWNKGIMTKIIRVLVQYAFDELKVIRIYASIFEKNMASGRVLEKAGFHHEATHKKAVIKNGQLMDELVYAIVKEDYEK